MRVCIPTLEEIIYRLREYYMHPLSGNTCHSNGCIYFRMEGVYISFLSYFHKKTDSTPAKLLFGGGQQDLTTNQRMLIFTPRQTSHSPHTAFYRVITYNLCCKKHEQHESPCLDVEAFAQPVLEQLVDRSLSVEP